MRGTTTSDDHVTGLLRNRTANCTDFSSRGILIPIIAFVHIGRNVPKLFYVYYYSAL